MIHFLRIGRLPLALLDFDGYCFANRSLSSTSTMWNSGDTNRASLVSARAWLERFPMRIGSSFKVNGWMHDEFMNVAERFGLSLSLRLRLLTSRDV